MCVCVCVCVRVCVCVCARACTYISDSDSRGGLMIVGNVATGLWVRFCSNSAVSEATSSALHH